MRNFLSALLKLGLLLTIFAAPLAHSDPQPVASGETPGSLACIYGLTSPTPGCHIDKSKALPTGGSGAIAIIDGQDDPTALAELTQFSSQFPGMTILLPCNGSNTNQPCFQQYYVNSPFSSTTPCVVANNNASTYNIGSTQDIEPALDIEWAHAMAPNASIYMVETQGWSNTGDVSALVNGVACATYLLQTYNGGGIISYSHSFPEWAGETAYDSTFQTPGIIYVASAGDYSAPANYPASSPYVIAAGGTEIQRDAAGNYIDQVAWHDPVPKCKPICKTGGSGGPSTYEARPAYQKSVQKIVGSQRGTPDISFVAANVNVFCCQLATNNNCCGGTTGTACSTFSSSICPTTQGAWVTTGGTSLASPALAGVINSAHSGATTTTQELTLIYNGAIKNYHSYWTDIISGNNGFPALAGYDFTTGLGVPRGYSGK